MVQPVNDLPATPPRKPGEYVSSSPTGAGDRAHPRRPASRPADFWTSLLLYLLISLWVLWPYRTSTMRKSGDFGNVIAGIVEAANAIGERQFPIRVAPRLNAGLRYPLFQYYGNFPYSAAGGLRAVFGLDPYTAWKIVTLASLVFGAYFVRRLALVLSNDRVGSCVAGAVFLCTPYLLTDINARGAFAEMMAFELLPAAFYFSLMCVLSPRLRHVAACAVLWTLVGLTHNITYVYGVTFAALFVLPFLIPPRRWPRLARLAAAGSLHAGLFAWYVVPQLKTLSILVIHQGTGTPFDWAPLTPLKVLLAPVFTNSEMGMTTPGLGLQVGWPILGFVLLAVAGLFARPMHRFRWWSAVYLIGLFLLGFFISWSPFDFWRYLPKLFWFIQFPYRAMMFVVLTGSVLAAPAVAAWPSRMRGAGAIIAILAILGLSLSTYLPRPDSAPGFIQQMIDAPDMGPAAALMYLPDPASIGVKGGAAPVRDGVVWTETVAAVDARRAAGDVSLMTPPRWHIEYGGKFVTRISVDQPVLLELPVLYYPGLLDVRDNGKKIRYRNAGQLLALGLTPGRHRIDVRFAGVGWANVLGAACWGGLAMAVLLAGIRAGLRYFRSTGGWAAAAPVSPATVMIGFVAMTVVAAVPVVRPVQRLLDFSPQVKRALASSVDGDHGPQLAFDHDPETIWIATDSGPTVLTAEFSKSGTLRGLVLEPRQTSLYECWQHVRVILFDRDRKVYEGDFALGGAARRSQTDVAVPPTRVDKIELRFSEPVLDTLDGKRVTPADVHPGYREIRFQWK